MLQILVYTFTDTDFAFVRSKHEVECRNNLPRFKYFQKRKIIKVSNNNKLAAIFFYQHEISLILIKGAVL